MKDYHPKKGLTFGEYGDGVGGSLPVRMWWSPPSRTQCTLGAIPFIVLELVKVIRRARRHPG
jgi:hypothetical protein